MGNTPSSKPSLDRKGTKSSKRSLKNSSGIGSHGTTLPISTTPRNYVDMGIPEEGGAYVCTCARMCVYVYT